MVLTNTPTNENENVFYVILDVLCQKFMGLSPFEILNTPFDEVMQLYVDCVLHSKNEKENGTNEDVQWVTSKTATWH